MGPAFVVVGGERWRGSDSVGANSPQSAAAERLGEAWSARSLQPSYKSSNLLIKAPTFL
ncbi:hypothetical protein [Siminovitchia acidinfaciens]|uniref:hypothetical protein n=1 Tax=Siminovitchia acidinfaciens TaxID=2321395 RepID=UPI0013E05B25|nr:hypothetical protein [Siminovitchia acidinfaciens]